MVTKDDRPGLLSKVAMFVRNPTKDWSELDQPLDSDATAYDKQALKAMIERKRQNDFVRKREFDQLRKLRNRDPGAIASMARPSFFQTSLPTDVGGRAVTLKKIDEIEAQMSRQWWKSKGDGSTTAGALAAPEGVVQNSDEPSSESFAGNSGMSTPFASTEPIHMKGEPSAGLDGDFLPTQMATGMAPVSAPDAAEGRDARTETNSGFSTSRLFAIAVDEIATDPELEEAAIRFANGDDAGAENGLLSALRGNDLDPQAAQSWAAAVLDFYRATENQQAFDRAVREFALHLDGVEPVWSRLADAAAAGAPARSGAAQPIWSSPATLTAADMENLRAAMVSQPMPWYLAWNELQDIAPDAMPLMDALFSSLCDEAVSLRLDGVEQVAQALRALTPSGRHAVDPSWWQVRLNALRAMGLQDDFELAALDYCVTYEVAPPAWVDAQCQIEAAGSRATAPGTETGLQEGDRALVLQGELVGDATQALSALEAETVANTRLFISCAALVRVDFAAAGSILSWVAVRQSEGNQIQFQDVHRLVAAFFNVIGINEYAKVVPRSI